MHIPFRTRVASIATASLLAWAGVSHAGVTYHMQTTGFMYVKATDTQAETNPDAANFYHQETAGYQWQSGDAGLSLYGQFLEHDSQKNDLGSYRVQNEHLLGAYAGFPGNSGSQDTAYQGFSAIEFDSAGPLLIDFQFGGWSIFTADREDADTESAWAKVTYELFWSTKDADGNWIRGPKLYDDIVFQDQFLGNSLSYASEQSTYCLGCSWIGDYHASGPGRIELWSTLEGHVKADYEQPGGCRDTSVPCTVPEPGSVGLLLLGLAGLGLLRRERMR